MGDKSKNVTLDHTIFESEAYFKISNHDSMRPFFMNIVSDGNHWMFISSNGGLTAGRKNPEYALFPYYTDDKITEFADITGSKSIFQISTKDNVSVWEPFSDRNTDRFKITRNLYKSTYGNKLIFEEVNHDLKLTFRYQWNTSNIFGFVKKAELINQSDAEYSITVLDGIQNIMPYGVSPDLQMTTSNLADAYKRSELVRDAGLGIFALSAIIVDKAEPSEALKANVVWSCGFEQPEYLLSSLQLDKFRNQKALSEEEDIKAEKGAYFVLAKIELAANATKKWKIVANVNQNHAQIISLVASIKQDLDLDTSIQNDINEGTKNLLKLNASADAIQYTSDHLQDARHFSNVLFNIMRGGIFDHHYQVEKEDYLRYLDHLNKTLVVQNQATITKMPDLMTHKQIRQFALESKDADLIRLSVEYLPLKFSRRHGDPSRPWNKFSINTQNEIDGSKILDYEGNWRDIFQNWEALALSYPEFIESMIFKFVNATTFDGYNPYRVTKNGFDWETIEPDNPWSYIGYWGDHQVIYLLKFLEFVEKYQPSTLAKLLDQKYFVYANVPYRIKDYQDILQDPKNTISFDEEKDAHIRERIVEIGADGALLQAQSGDVMHVSFIEKLLAVVLSKMSNFIPEGGIWMNTQRPEWNDANNALVGNGVSMVTLYYLRRFFTFLDTYLAGCDVVSTQLSGEQAVFFNAIYETLKNNKSKLNSRITDTDRKNITDALGLAGSTFRNNIYGQGFSGQKQAISISEVQNFVGVCMKYIDHTINVNKRNDSLYHAYNLLTISEDSMAIDHLSEMLEGQVAVISSGYLSSQETLAVLDGMRSSALYRTDQNSYLLYPNKELPKFLEKNNIDSNSVESNELLNKLLTNENYAIVQPDIHGSYHFNGNFKNASDVQLALDQLAQTGYEVLVEKCKDDILQIFENVFNHKAFTGRSGTFYAYEGLGSIYWHMVSKLHLAVQESLLRAIDQNDDTLLIGKLSEHYDAIGAGIGIHKSPALYGAFPSDPYSHTPMHRGAQQPGMTGQVKEDIIVRMAELGIRVVNGKLGFEPALLKKDEFLKEAKICKFIDIHGQQIEIAIEQNSLLFTYCQIPVVYTLSDRNGISLEFYKKSPTNLDSLELNEDMSQQIFGRNGIVKVINVLIQESHLRQST